MRFYFICLLLTVSTLSCKNNNKNPLETTETNHMQGHEHGNPDEMVYESGKMYHDKDGKMLHAQQPYPEAIKAVFNAHGGYATWDKMNNLCFQVEGRNGAETHTTDLKNRHAKIQTEDYTMGYDGINYWVAQDKKVYKPERVKFTHNLMFYFYAMPFVLGDNGITYHDVDPLEIDGKSYRGVKIYYGQDVGLSEKDNYILYADPETNKMAWLAYTATFGKEEPSNRYNFIKYSNWQEIEGLLLPKTLQWYTVEDGKPTEVRNEVTFDNVSVSETKLADKIFSTPKNAAVAE